jgi:hypothetical protein
MKLTHRFSPVKTRLQGIALLACLLAGPSAAAQAACYTSGHTSGRDEASLRRAEAILDANGVGGDYQVTRFVPYPSGAGMVEVRRLYKGTPVFQDQLGLHFDAQQRLRRDSRGAPIRGGDAATLPALELDPQPRVDSETAKRTFAAKALVIELTDHRGRPSGSMRGPDYRARLDELGAELGIYDGALAWQVCPPRGPAAYISAEDGTVLYFHSGVIARVAPTEKRSFG